MTLTIWWAWCTPTRWSGKCASWVAVRWTATRCTGEVEPAGAQARPPPRSAAATAATINGRTPTTLTLTGESRRRGDSHAARGGGRARRRADADGRLQCGWKPDAQRVVADGDANGRDGAA